MYESKRNQKPKHRMMKPRKHFDNRKKFKKFRPFFTSLDRLRRMQRRALRPTYYRNANNGNIALVSKSFHVLGPKGKGALQCAVATLRASTTRQPRRSNSAQQFSKHYVTAGASQPQHHTRYVVEQKYRLKLSVLASYAYRQLQFTPRPQHTVRRT
jgi:hypothetical protein